MTERQLRVEDCIRSVFREESGPVLMGPETFTGRPYDCEEFDVIDMSWSIYDRDFYETKDEFGDGVLAGDHGVFGGLGLVQKSDFADGSGCERPGGARKIHCYNCGNPMLVEPDLKDVIHLGKVEFRCRCGYKNRLTFDKLMLAKSLGRILSREYKSAFKAVAFRFRPIYVPVKYEVQKIYYLYRLVREKLSVDRVIRKLEREKMGRENES